MTGQGNAYNQPVQLYTFQKWKREKVGERAEKARRRMVQLIFLIYWLRIFEGALRKWVFPQYFRELFSFGTLSRFWSTAWLGDIANGRRANCCS